MSKILLMEDDLVVSHHVQKELERIGHTVVVRTSASEAIEELLLENYDILISDIIVMKNQRAVTDGGIALINWVRGSSKCKNMPIIAISGTLKYPGMGNILKAAQQVGADVGLEKPVIVSDLLAEIDHLSKYSAADGQE